MRFFGIIGLLTLLGFAFILSKHKKKIRLQTILWGISLQFLLAIIILCQNWLSWVGMYIFLILIIIYICKDDFYLNKKSSNMLMTTFLLIIGSAAIITVSYFADTISLAVPVLLIILFICLILKVIKHANYIKFLLGTSLPILLGLTIQRGIYGQDIFAKLADQITAFLKLTDIGSMFLFGNLADSQYFDQFGFQFAFSILPIIIFFSTIIAILYHLGIMQIIVEMMAKFMHWTMGTSGAETLSCASNIFVGQTEAPFLIRPFLDKMTMSELHAVMVGGFATIAGSVLAGYIGMGISAKHLIAASIMSAPAALVMAKIIFPETEESLTAGYVKMPKTERAVNVLDAASKGVTEGLKLALNVAAMLVAFKALIGLVDVIMAFLDKTIDGYLLGNALNEVTNEYIGIFPGSLKSLFGFLFSPLAFAMGVPWVDAADVGNLLGIKITATEFVAYADLSTYIEANTLTPKAITIATYALCGFANFASIGIQIGGIGALAPSRRSDLARVALRAMIAGALASWLTATIAGMLL